MRPLIPLDHPLRRFFAGSLADAFYAQLGICSPPLVDYLANLLIDFVHVRDIYALKSVSGDTLRSISEMVAQAYLGPEVTGPVRERLVQRHVGDYVLYWTGIYPEQFTHPHSLLEPTFDDYITQGKRAYSIACELSTPDDEPPPSTLELLSVHFEDCAQGLQLARRQWDHPTPPPDSHLL
ncbi:MAG: hypothetical protein HJJLKODD_01085 [Phycisphaerae bacterium]|nr:hypothetical protein [Phycisphaerae bacterium]